MTKELNGKTRELGEIKPLF